MSEGPEATGRVRYARIAVSHKMVRCYLEADVESRLTECVHLISTRSNDVTHRKGV